MTEDFPFRISAKHFPQLARSTSRFSKTEKAFIKIDLCPSETSSQEKLADPWGSYSGRCFRQKLLASRSENDFEANTWAQTKPSRWQTEGNSEPSQPMTSDFSYKKTPSSQLKKSLLVWWPALTRTETAGSTTQSLRRRCSLSCVDIISYFIICFKQETSSFAGAFFVSLLPAGVGAQPNSGK